MARLINNYSYTNASGDVIKIRTERYGVYGFDVFVTIDNLQVSNRRSNLFKNLNNEWLIRVGEVNGRCVFVKPANDVLAAMLADKSRPTAEREQYDAVERERKQKEREWDNLYNEGAEGYNPYRRRQHGINDNTPYHKGDNYAE